MATSTMVGDATWTRPSRTHSFDGGEKGKKFIDLLSLAAPKKYENENQQKANADDCAIFCCFVAPLYKTVPHPPAPPSPPNEAGNPCKWRLIEDLLGGSPLWLDGWPLKCDLEEALHSGWCAHHFAHWPVNQLSSFHYRIRSPPLTHKCCRFLLPCSTFVRFASF